MISHLLIAALCLAQTPTLEAERISVRVERVGLEPASWRSLPQVELEVTESDETVRYSGIPLAHLLQSRADSESSSTVADWIEVVNQTIIVTCADGGRETLPAAAVALDGKGQRYLLAIGRNGKPLGEREGSVRLIVAGKPTKSKPVRTVRALAVVKLLVEN